MVYANAFYKHISSDTWNLPWPARNQPWGIQLWSRMNCTWSWIKCVNWLSISGILFPISHEANTKTITRAQKDCVCFFRKGRQWSCQQRARSELCSSTTPTSQFSSLHFIASKAIGAKSIERRTRSLDTSSFGRQFDARVPARFGADCRSAGGFHTADDDGEY